MDNDRGPELDRAPVVRRFLIAHLRRVRRRGLTVLALAAAACSKSDSTGPTITRVDVAPPTLTLTGIGVTGGLTATVLGPLGAPITNATVSWTSDNPTVATVVGSNLAATVTAVAAGTAVIRAQSGNMTGTSTVTVNASVRSVRITPGPITVRAAETGNLGATVDADPGVSQAVTWASNATNVATVSATGVVTGVQQGVATVTATSVADPTKSNSVVVTVTPAAVATVTVSITNNTLNVGQTAQATARTFDLQNRELTGRAVTWSSAAPTLASVSATGLVTALSRSANAVAITATSEGKTGSVGVTVRGIISVTVSPQTLTTPIGSLLQLSVTVDIDPGTGFSSAVTWLSRNPAIVTVTTSGVISALASGSVYVVATSTVDLTKKDSALVTVPNPCAAPIAHTLGTSVTGQITAFDCGGIFDQYAFSVATQTFYAANLAPTSNQNLSPLLPDMPVTFILNANSPATAIALVPAGNYRMQVAARDASSRGSYTLSTLVNPTVTCPFVLTTFNVSRGFALSGCPAYTPSGLSGAFTAETFWISVPANRQLRVSVLAATFQARIELKTVFGTVTLLGSAFATAAGNTAVITFTPTVQTIVAAIVTSQTPGSTGNFTLTIDP